jgi:hypothetical protein
MSFRCAATTWALLFALPCPAQAEREPNDTPAQAQRIVPGAAVAARLSSTADVDWYVFTLTEPAQVSLRASTGSLPWQAPRDVLVALYDARGVDRLAWDERSEGACSDCGVTVPAGTYTCLVAMPATGNPGIYTLEFAARPPRPIDVPEAPEPNDHPAFGGAPTAIRLGDTVAGELATADDVDWFTFALTGRGIVHVVCHDDGGVPQLDSTRLQLWRRTPTGAWSPLGTTSYLRTSHRAFDPLHTTNLPGGNYLGPGHYAIQVDANTSTPVGTAPWHYRKQGHYALRTAWIEFTGRGPVGAGGESNDSARTAAPLTLGEDAVGAIGADGEADWYRFEVTQPTTIGATAEGEGPHPVRVTSLRLWSADGGALASGTGTSSAHGQLIHTLAVAGSYFLEVRGRLFADTGGYRLRTGACQPLHLPTPPRPPEVDAAAPAEASVTPRAPATTTPVDARHPAVERPH